MAIVRTKNYICCILPSPWRLFVMMYNLIYRIYLNLMSKPKTVLQQRRKLPSLPFDFFWTATKKRTDRTFENVLRSFTFLVLGKSCIRVQPAIMTQEPGKSWIGVWNLKCGITRNLLVCYHQFLLTNVSTTNFYFSPSISSPFPPPISTDQLFHHQFLLTNFANTNFYWPTFPPLISTD